MTLKYHFFNDYSEGAHPDILKIIAETNFIQEDGYGYDSLSRSAERKIKDCLQRPEAEVHLVTGGTQANMLVLAALLRPFESVIAAGTAHIHIHEAGAVEATGHKINTVPSLDGKLTPPLIESVVSQHTDEHMVKPRAVFISNSTELGTVYTRRDLEEIQQCCRKHGLFLYLDGARLGSALVSKGSDLSLAELANLVDVFYIGGTKNGALFGEAIVINNKDAQADFRYHMKQRGALLAKGRVLGAQFLGLFQDDLFYKLARHANAMAERMALCIQEHEYGFLSPPATNQVFPILPDHLIESLQELYGFYVWSKVDADHSAIRLVTSWATPPAVVDEFIQDFSRLATSLNKNNI